jgi:acyl carrier protein
MHPAREKLIKCFSTIFPELSVDEIVSASPRTSGAWDSLTAVTLMALVEEEFGIELEPNGDPEGMSFENLLMRIATALDSRISAGVCAQTGS